MFSRTKGEREDWLIFLLERHLYSAPHSWTPLVGVWSLLAVGLFVRMLINIALITARIFFTFISSFRSSNIWISYIHNFIFIFPGYITNQFNHQLPVGLLAQLVRALYRYCRGQGSNPGKPYFFRLSFRNCISCVNNCEDLLYIY